MTRGVVKLTRHSGLKPESTGFAVNVRSHRVTILDSGEGRNDEQRILTTLPRGTAIIAFVGQKGCLGQEIVPASGGGRFSFMISAEG